MPVVAAAAAAIVTSISAVAATAVGAAVGLVGGSALGLAAASATFAAVPGLLFSAGLSLAAGLLQPHVGQTAAGTQVDWQADPSAGVPYLIGRTGTAGNIVFVDTSGDKHKYLTYVTVLSGGGPISDFESFSANGVAVTFGADGGEGASGYYLNRMWRVARFGGRPASPLQFSATGSKDTPADHGGNPSTLGTNPRLSGLAADVWSLEYDANVYTAGVPKPLRVIKGVLAYDPRKDSTYPGGSGSHRWADPSNTAAFDAAVATWEWTENPHLHALKWCLGAWERDTSNAASTYRRTLGVGAPIAAIDVAAFVQGANVNDANAMKVGGVVYSTDAKWDVLTAMLQAGASRPLKLGAKISCLPQMPRVTLDTIRGGDLVDTATVQGTQASRDRINTIWPRYREETQGWEIVPTGGVVGVGEYAALDGAIRTKEVTYSLCQNATQAAQLARYDIEDSRELGPITLPCKPYWMGYKPGDCIIVDEPEIGLVGAACLILNRSQDPATMAVTLTLRTETAGKHAFALGQTQTPPPQPSLAGVDPVQVSAPPSADWGCIGGASTSASGQSLPAIVITGKVTDPNVAEVIVEYRLTSGTVWADAGTMKAADPVAMTITGLAPQTSYVPRLRYRSVRGQVAPDASTLTLEPVTTGGVATDWASVTDPLSKKPADNATVGATVGTGGNLIYVPTGGGAPVMLQPADVITSQGTAGNTAKVGDKTAATLIANVETAISNASDAVTQVDTVAARGATSPNLIPNGGLENGFSGWRGPGSPWNLITDGYWGRYAQATIYSGSGPASLISAPFPVAAGRTLTLAADVGLVGGIQPGDYAYVDVFVWPVQADAQSLNYAAVGTYDGPQTPLSAAHDFSDDDTCRNLTKVTFTPTITGWAVARVVADSSAPSGNPAYVRYRLGKCEPGAVMTPYSPEGTNQDLSASVTVSQGAIADAQSKLAAAYFSVVAAASGANPAYVKLASSTLGGFLALVADRVVLGSADGSSIVTALELYDGKAFFSQPIYISAAGGRLIIGPAFGADTDLLLWYGPEAIDHTTATRANAQAYFSIDGFIRGPGLPGTKQASGHYSGTSFPSAVALDAPLTVASGGVSAQATFGAVLFGTQTASSAGQSYNATVTAQLQRSDNGGGWYNVGQAQTFSAFVECDWDSGSSRNTYSGSINGQMSLGDSAMTSGSQNYRLVFTTVALSHAPATSCSVNLVATNNRG